MILFIIYNMLLLSDSGSYAPGVMDNRTRQWLGATVRSSGENGKILVSNHQSCSTRSNGCFQLISSPKGNHRRQ